MTVSLSGMSEWLGAHSSDHPLVLECLEEAVSGLERYLRHLRVIETLEDGTRVLAGEVSATRDDTDPANPEWTWTDTRVIDTLEHWSGTVPATVLDRATREVCSDLFARRNAPNGIVNAQFASGDGPGASAVRINRDPLTPAYPLLSRWVVPF